MQSNSHYFGLIAQFLVGALNCLHKYPDIFLDIQFRSFQRYLENFGKFRKTYTFFF